MNMNLREKLFEYEKKLWKKEEAEACGKKAAQQTPLHRFDEPMNSMSCRILKIDVYLVNCQQKFFIT
jgi:hypothetical protein